MDRLEPDVTAIVKKMKDGARASPWFPFGAPPRERYHHFPDGLNLCFTLDILSKVHVNRLVQAIEVKLPEELSEGGKFWHLSITRLGDSAPTPEEVEFWRQAFFEEEPIMGVGGMVPGVNARHFFWRAESAL